MLPGGSALGHCQTHTHINAHSEVPTLTQTQTQRTDGSNKHKAKKQKRGAFEGRAQLFTFLSYVNVVTL